MTIRRIAVGILLMLILPVDPASAGLMDRCLAKYRKLINRAPYVIRPELDHKVQQFLSAGRWIKENMQAIDPKTTHLEPVVPLVRDIRAQTTEALKSKVGQERYALQKPMVEKILKEIDERIASKQVTYEWAYGLPYRLGFLMKMEGTPQFLRPGSDPAFVFEAERYSTHLGFIELLQKIENHPVDVDRGSYRRKCILVDVSEDLKDFPKLRSLPFTGDMDFRPLNHAVSEETWPIGVVSKPMPVHADLYDEFGFAHHDGVHARARYEQKRPEQVPSQIVGDIDRDVLQQIEGSPVSPQDFATQHYLHYMTFHEPSGANFILMNDDGKWTREVSEKTVQNAFNELMKFSEEYLKTDRHYRDELFRYAKTPNTQDASFAIERNIKLYKEKLRSAIERRMGN